MPIWKCLIRITNNSSARLLILKHLTYLHQAMNWQLTDTDSIIRITISLQWQHLVKNRNCSKRQHHCWNMNCLANKGRNCMNSHSILETNKVDFSVEGLVGDEAHTVGLMHQWCQAVWTDRQLTASLNSTDCLSMELHQRLQRQCHYYQLLHVSNPQSEHYEHHILYGCIPFFYQFPQDMKICKDAEGYNLYKRSMKLTFDATR